MSAPRPLQKVRVLDFSWVGAGPYVTRSLASMGAEVIKVETRSKLDPIRMMHPAAGGQTGVNRSGYFANRNPDKLSIALDLKAPGGVSVARRLASASDVILNNFRPGVLNRLGLGWEEMREINPKVIYVDMPMQGIEGPHASYVGYGLTLSALSGLYSLSGEPGKPPIGTGTNFPDHVPNPLHAAGAILCALRMRSSTGSGLRIEISQLESTVRVIGPAIVSASAGLDVLPRGNLGHEWVPHGIFRCTGDNPFIAIVVRSDEEWAILCREIECPHWAEDSNVYARMESRLARREKVEADLGEIVAKSDGRSLALRLGQAGVPAAVVEDARTLVDVNEQLSARSHWVRLEHKEMGGTLYDSMPFRLDGQLVAPIKPAPTLGEHTHEVLQRVLGMNDDEISEVGAGGAFQ